MKEIISIHIGQAGVQIGNACWELFCREHNIQADGTRNEDTSTADNSMHSSFFCENSKGNYTPRSLFVDPEPCIIDEIRKGSHKRLFNPDYLVSGKEDAANNFVRGSYNIGREMRPLIFDQIRKLAEACDNLEGFIFTHAVSGGTGSGLFEDISMEMERGYEKKIKQCFTVFPSPDISNIVVEPYNAMMSMSWLNDVNSVVMLDNQALYKICSEHLNIEYPTFTNINRLIAQLISSSTVSMRFSGGSLNCSMQEFHTNLIPYPRIHYLIPSLAPLIEINKTYHSQPDIVKVTESALKPDSSLFSCETYKGKYLACSMMYRGDVVPKDVLLAVNESKLKRDMSFINWMPTGFKTGICPKVMIENEDMRAVSKSLCMLSNNTAIIGRWKSLLNKFDRLWEKRPFVHWFLGEGIRSGEMYMTRDGLASIIADYEEVGNEHLNLEEEID